jgi:hypothetical protein
MLQNFAVIIWIYMPVSILLGWGLGRLHGLADDRRWHGLLAAGMLALIMIAGMARRSDLEADQFAMVTFPDLAAMDWIVENTPEDALFLVQGFGIYEGRSIVGSDAGWWLPLYTQRLNTIPPQYAIFNEQPIDPDYSLAVIEDVAKLEGLALDSPEGLEYLCRVGVTHVFNGHRRGLVGSGLDAALFSSDELAAQPALDRVYAQDRVEIYALDQDLCSDDS